MPYSKVKNALTQMKPVDQPTDGQSGAGQVKNAITNRGSKAKGSGYERTGVKNSVGSPPPGSGKKGY